MSDRPVVLIVGPTAVGKTEVSIQLARRLNAEIISADSRLFYRGMDIGTAKPSLAQRKAIPHHLIDIAEPDETVTLASFQQLAHAAIADIQGRGRLPVLVGGTGQYMRAVTTGWAPPRVPPDARLRAILHQLADKRGSEWLLGRLGSMDPEAAHAMDHRNVRRSIRAMEVILTTGRKFSLQRGRNASPYNATILGLNLPRPVLYARVDDRIDRMFDAGLLEETRRLLAAGYSPDLPAMSAIGYRESIKLLRGELQLDQAKSETKRATRAFVRRQMNWFKLSDPPITWFSPDDEHVVDAMESVILEKLAELDLPVNPALHMQAAQGDSE